MRGWRAAGAIGVLLANCLPAAAQSQGQGRPSRSPAGRSNDLSTPSGIITVVVNDALGAPLTVIPTVTLTATTPFNPPMNFPSQQGNEWVFMNLSPGVQYAVQVDAPGFESSRQYVRLPYLQAPAERIEFYLDPSSKEGGIGAGPGEAILAPRVQKEVQQGIKDLTAKKFDSAQKHLGIALGMAPASAQVNYLLGESWLQAGKAAEAAPYLEKAVSLDPRQTQALVALGTAKYEQGDMGKAIEALSQATAATPESWQAHWLLAAAFLSAGNAEQASREASSALKYGKGSAEPAKLILAEALARLGKREEAREAFTEYLGRNPKAPHADQIRGFIAALSKPPPEKAEATGPSSETAAPNSAGTAAAPAVPATAPASIAADSPPAIVAPTPPPPAPATPRESWAPLDVDQEKPEVIAGVACHLPRILKRAGANAAELVADLEKFSATEEYEAVEIGKNGELKQPEARQFSYLVFIDKIRPHLIHIDEMRVPNPAALPTTEPLMSTGLPALALVFHPDYAGDFAWKCEGMGRWRGQPAWVIHFEQRTDRPTSPISAFITQNGQYRLALKGRAWVAANGDQVLHLVVELDKPLEAAQLEREHFAVDYRLATFRSNRVALWLPERVDAYFRYRGHSYHQYSRFSHYELFWTDTQQKIAEPRQTAVKP